MSSCDTLFHSLPIFFLAYQEISVSAPHSTTPATQPAIRPCAHQRRPSSVWLGLIWPSVAIATKHYAGLAKTRGQRVTRILATSRIRDIPVAFVVKKKLIN